MEENVGRGAMQKRVKRIHKKYQKTETAVYETRQVVKTAVEHARKQPRKISTNELALYFPPLHIFRLPAYVQHSFNTTGGRE